MIESGELSVHGDRAYVWGFVRRESLGEPPPWAHVDVFILDRNGKTTESVTVNYLPREIPHGSHGMPPHSMFSARLNKAPAVGSTILIVFNSKPKSDDKT